MKTGTIVLIIAIVLIFATVIILLFRKGWKCTEGHCEQVILGGEYSSKEKCKEVCEKKPQKTVTFRESISEVPNYACTSDYRCIEADNGDYTSKEACEKNCQAPTYYYPQTLYYRRPYYYGPGRRFHHHGRHRRHGGGRRPGGGGRRRGSP